MKKSLRVGDMMTKELVTVSPDTGVMRAISIMVMHDVSGVPVVEQGRLVGILTERDCIVTAAHSGYFDEPGGRVAEYMSSPVETVGPHTTLMDLAERFLASRFRRFPVIDDGKLVGLVSRRDVLEVLNDSAWFDNR